MHRGAFFVRLGTNQGQTEAIVSKKRDISILIADDRCQVRRALRTYLQLKLGGDRFAEAGDLKQALSMALVLRPDVVLLDWELPAQGGAQVLAGLRAAHPGVLVVALSSKLEARKDALAAGADAFVSKGEPADRLIASMDG